MYQLIGKIYGLSQNAFFVHFSTIKYLFYSFFKFILLLFGGSI